MIFFPFKKAGAHLNYVCNNSAKFPIDSLKILGEVHYTTFFRGDGWMDGKTDRVKTNCTHYPTPDYRHRGIKITPQALALKICENLYQDFKNF